MKYTKVAPYAQIYWTDTSYTLETKQNAVPVFTNSNQVSTCQILEHTHFMSHPMWVITEEAKQSKLLSMLLRWQVNVIYKASKLL